MVAHFSVEKSSLVHQRERKLELPTNFDPVRIGWGEIVI